MIAAKTILQLVRFKQKDNNEILFSDYDIKNALNEALRYIVQSQALDNSDFLEKVVVYDEREMNQALLDEAKENEAEEEPELYDFALKGVELPEDYQILVGVAYTYPPNNDAVIHGNLPLSVYPHISLSPCDITKVPNHREYKILGEKIYCGVRRFQLAYRRTILPVNDLEVDEIDLPVFCTDLIVKMTGMILNNADTDVMMQAIDMATKSIIPRRRFNNMRIKMPFYV